MNDKWEALRQWTEELNKLHGAVAKLATAADRRYGDSLATAKAKLSIATVKARNSGQCQATVNADDLAVLLAAHSDLDRQLSALDAASDKA